MKKQISFIITILFLSASSFYAQNINEQITFFKTYGDTAEDHNDRGYAVLQTEDGGFIAAGNYGQHSVGTPSHYYGDVYLIKTDEYGDTIWTKTYGEPNRSEAAYSMDKTDDGGYIISAFIERPLWHLWILKINSEGDTIWTKIFPLRVGNCIRQTNDKGYIITGYNKANTELDQSDLYLLKTDSLGDTLWLKTYNNSSQDEGCYVQQTSDGGFIIAGVTIGNHLDIWLIKTDSTGDTLWTKIYGDNYIDEPHSILELEDGGFLVAGEYTEEGELGLEAHILLLKTDSNGDSLWTKKINNGSWGDYAYAMKKTSDGGFIIAGETEYDSFDSDIYLIKMNGEGNFQWTSSIGNNLGRIGDEKHYRAYDIEETSDGGYILTGFEWIYIGSDEYQDLCLLKLDDKGEITGIGDAKTNNILNHTLSQNYPNPFNPTTIIAYALPEASSITLKIFDILGREIAELVNEFKTAGTYSVQFDGTGLASGIYFYQLNAGNFAAVKKLMLLK